MCIVPDPLDAKEFAELRAANCYCSSCSKAVQYWTTDHPHKETKEEHPHKHLGWGVRERGNHCNNLQ